MQVVLETEVDNKGALGLYEKLNFFKYVNRCDRKHIRTYAH
jgi:ribosomal protein S18 acetylase RimI-like enzyme